MTDLPKKARTRVRLVRQPDAGEEARLRVSARGRPGIFHLTNSGLCISRLRA
jgi:hypothetical protein